MRTILYSLITLYFILTLGLFIYFNSKMEESIMQVNNGVAAKLESNRSLSKEMVLHIQTLKRDKTNVTIEIKELDKINNHIKFLTEEVQKQYSLTQNLIDNDINRLNLFITIGIGFLGFIGVFVPILTNLISSNDLSDRLSGLEVKTTDSTTKIDDLSTRTDQALPVIEALRIHNSFARFINMSPHLLTHLRSKNGQKYFSDILRSIKTNLEDLIQKHHLLLNDYQIRTSLNDFQVSIDSWHYVIGLHSRATYRNFLRISDSLKIILDDKTSDANRIISHNAIINDLENIISNLSKPSLK